MKLAELVTGLVFVNLRLSIYGDASHHHFCYHPPQYQESLPHAVTDSSTCTRGVTPARTGLISFAKVDTAAKISKPVEAYVILMERRLGCIVFQLF